ncbi:MAG TPA: hypothetical protein PKY82_10745 [Pyrinomonadaceae bacterium]|nr:hypothetical protein [Pyrinomonadaceae bacterium]
MKKIFILFTLIIGFGFTVNAQTPTVIQFAKGASSKTMTVTIKPNSETKYSITVKKGQVINIGVSGDIGVSKTNDFPVIHTNLDNGVDDVDNWQDGEGYLSILAGKNGKYIFTVSNSDKKRARTFKMEVKVSNNKDDYEGGTE